MSILDILYTIFIMPLQLAFETLYMLTNSVINNPGLSIVTLSLMMNFLVLPLYMRADAMQEHERDMENKLRRGVNHIKKTFKGNEKSMMLSTYYKQNGYKPTDVFKGSISLFLEIPFFISAYMFLSNLELIKGVEFWFISDLGAPDGLITIGGLTINLLPFVMTGINLISCILFTKGMPAKTKVQLYGMAIFFLVFLYSSPAGLVFYWTLNNIFALVKTIFYKLKHPKQVLCILFAIAGAALAIYAQTYLPIEHPKACVVLTVAGIGCIVPSIVLVVKTIRGSKHKHLHQKPKQSKLVPNTKSFVAGTVFLTVLIGFLIPSAVIASSAEEFVNLVNYSNPLWFVISSTCLAIGTFIVWFGVFYWLCKPRGRAIFEIGVWIFAFIAVIDYMFFGTNLGTLSSSLQYENGMVFSSEDLLINLVCVLAIALAIIVLARFKIPRKLIPRVLAIAAIAVIGMGAFNVVQINAQTQGLAQKADEIAESNPHFSLSKNGKNVVVIMLDRALGDFVPNIMEEKPELKEVYSGFTYYANVISYGGYTNIGTPPLYGGYEYTPEEMNKRSSELLKDKQNEALKVMPVIFDNNNYHSTVIDPTYANYDWIPDISIYDEYPNIDAYTTNGVFDQSDSVAQNNQLNKRNFFCFGITKSMPLFAQETFYNKGAYNSSSDSEKTLGQKYSDDGLKAKGTNEKFLKAYNVLNNMNTMTSIDDGSTNTFMMMSNDTTHEPNLLQLPDYELSENVDNTGYEKVYADENYQEMSQGQKNYIDTHYHSIMAALKKIGDWINYLKENEVYDNTKIILVSDHGRDIEKNKELIEEDKDGQKVDYELFYPLLMVKDFGSTGFSVDETFMTNADVPTLAFEDLISNPINPSTGKQINNAEKTAHSQHVFGSEKWSIESNNGTTFLPDGRWFSVSDDMRDKNNWQQIDPPQS